MKNKQLKNIIKGVFILILINLSNCNTTIAQPVTWYIPWQNKTSNLQVVPNTQAIPVLLNSKNYRILKVRNTTTFGIKLSFSKIIVSNKNVSVKISSLPAMRDFKNNEILDVILPLNLTQSITLPPISSAYFLIEYSGLQAGNASVSFSLNRNIPTFSQSVVVGTAQSSNQLNLNVWAYFNNPLIEGLKTTVLNDLTDHKVNVLVIPPAALPSVTAGDINTTKLSDYLEGTNGRFSKYLLFMNYKSSADFMSDAWKTNFLNWYQATRQAFVASGIDFSKAVLYPFDEPDLTNATKLVAMIQWCRSNNIASPFYTTLSAQGTGYLTQYVDITQVYSGNESIINEVLNTQNRKSELWLYEIKAAGRNLEPTAYLNMGWKAQKQGAKGIGAWNYCEVGSGFNKQFSAITQSLMGTWGALTDDPVHDYSMIYRKGNDLFSSLRWAALAFAKDDYDFINLYRSKYGKSKTETLINNLLNKTTSLTEWESIKLSLLQ
ncbi:hypothetical protein [Niabella sp.]|uniref:hypothetical protein n=1 Tax=Niabella sp. TaxID=1962976 RepID=UPI002607CF19|nr:hypothetical protein [Niabella sp.]